MAQSCLGAGKGHPDVKYLTAQRKPVPPDPANRGRFSAGVAFQYLLGIPFGVRQLCRHVEHDLFVAEVAVDRFGTGLPVSYV